MDAVVKSVAPGSPAANTIIAPGDSLRKINGKAVSDILDYKYLSYDERLLLELIGPNGAIKLVRLHKQEGADLGLEFDTFLMDKQRACANKCIFCFIDQLPEGMRETLYFKDDDVRLSFLLGNYVTLTNLSLRDIGRIIRLRISPINVSVHTLDPELRAYMLGVKNGKAGLDALRSLAGAGIMLNCQIVCCPGINDGHELSRTIAGLMELGGSINSVSVVPVGLTKHRRRLTRLRSFDRENALKTVRQVESFGEICIKRRGSRVFFCADELYIKAGIKLPPHRFYEDYPQLENGVGMMRLFITEFMRELRKTGVGNSEFRNPDPGFTIVTGMSASKYLTNLLKSATEKYDNIKGRVFAIRNDYFGDSVNVSGLITGEDIIAQLSGHDLGSRLLIPQNMLRSGEDVFLDNVTVGEISEALGIHVRVVRQEGAELFRALLND